MTNSKARRKEAPKAVGTKNTFDCKIVRATLNTDNDIFPKGPGQIHLYCKQAYYLTLYFLSIMRFPASYTNNMQLSFFRVLAPNINEPFD